MPSLTPHRLIQTPNVVQKRAVVGAPHRALGCLAHALEGGVRRRQRGVGTLPGPRITIPESMAKTASSASQRPKSRSTHGSPLSPAKVSVQEVVVEGHNSHPFTSHILWLNDFIDFSMIYGQHEFLQVHNAISLDMN